jgi:serine/threonine protein phosphatase PrpC
VLLAATDGLWKYAKRQHVAELVRAPPIEKASEALVDEIRLKSGSLQDDVAIAIIEYHG